MFTTPVCISFMSRHSLLINASNLHVGGGVAVATSFVSHLSTSVHARKILVVASSAVDLNLRSLGIDVSTFKAYIIHNSFVWSSIKTFLLLNRLNPKAIFTVFGPVYFPIIGSYHVMGLADPYLIYPDNYYLRLSSSILDRFFYRCYILIKSLFIPRTAHIIFETSAAEASFRSSRPVFRSNVVPSGYHDVHLSPKSWTPIAFPEDHSPSSIKLGLISKFYPHKDLQIIPAILEILNDRLSFAAVFFCTLSEDEFRKSKLSVSKYILNVGPLTLAQCPTFYSHLDGVLFPSLLESYSAVVPEAFVHQKPLFVSDIPCIRDVAGDCAFYFQPHDPNSAALAIYAYYNRSSMLRTQDYRFNIPLSTVSSASKRSGSYLSLLMSLGFL